MTEYKNILEKYSFEGYRIYGNNSIIDLIKAESFLKKYWIPKNEYISKWSNIQNKIFCSEFVSLPANPFRSNFQILPVIGGVLFTQEDYEILQKCILKIGDKELIIIQNNFGCDQNIEPFRMKFPIDLNWEELMSGDFISTVLFEMFKNEYFVFSESGSWGKYSANDYEKPFEFYGFKDSLNNIFRENIVVSDDDLVYINKYNPFT